MAQIEKLANIGTLACEIMHDINNPLYVILGFSENLLEEHHSMAVRDQALEVVQATKRIIKICEELKFYVRQSEPKDCTPVNLTQQLEEAMKVARYAVGLENITVIRAYSAHPMILAKPEEIVQILVNLVINALQAMDGRGTLTLEADCADRMATISVTLEIPVPGFLKKTCEKYLNPSDTTKPPGKARGWAFIPCAHWSNNTAGRSSFRVWCMKEPPFILNFPSHLSRFLTGTPEFPSSHTPTSTTWEESVTRDGKPHGIRPPHFGGCWIIQNFLDCKLPLPLI